MVLISQYPLKRILLWRIDILLYHRVVFQITYYSMLLQRWYIQFAITILWYSLQAFAVHDEQNSRTVEVNSFGEASVTVHFSLEFNNPPTVSAWARGNPQCTEKYAVTIQTITKSQFTVNIKCDGSSCNCGDRLVHLYWSATEFIDPVSKLLGDGRRYSAVDIPTPEWITTPSIVGVDKVFDVLGREVHLSVVHDLLAVQSKGKFPFIQTEGNSVDIILNVQADTVYVDQPVAEFPGLSQINIKARRFVSNNAELKLMAPTVCHQINNDVCYNPTKADVSYPGSNGKPGVQSAAVNLIAQQIVGNLELTVQGSNGSQPEAGGDGRPGDDQTSVPPKLSKGECCDGHCYMWTDQDKHCKGKKGYGGESGNDGREAGNSYSGGAAESVSIYAETLSGSINLEHIPGYGGHPASPGFAGKGGSGGIGGCGFRCHDGWWCEGWRCWHHCNDDSDCGNRGNTGSTGSPGKDGFEKGIPATGEMGSIASSHLRTIGSVKPWFELEADLLGVIRRYGETLYQRNDLDQTSAIFQFLLSVSDENSLFHKEIEVRTQWIKAGFDYYGHTETYAPDKAFNYWNLKTNKLLAAGDKVEDVFNSVSDQISNIVFVCETIQQVVSATVLQNTDDLEENYAELSKTKHKLVNVLSQVDESMQFEMFRITDLVPRAIIQTKEALKDTFTHLIRGLIGVTKNIVTGSTVGVIQSSLSLIHTISSMPDCDATDLEAAGETLGERIDFGYAYQGLDPEDMDFSSIKMDAVLYIKEDLSYRKDALISQLGCLIDYSKPDLAGNLTEAIDNYYNDGLIRATVIEYLMNVDIQRQEIEESVTQMEEVQMQVDTIVNGVENSAYVQSRMTLADGLFGFYQQLENIVMRSMYELSKSFEFSCLWEFDALSRYSSVFGDKATVSSTGQLEGMLQMYLIRNQLQNQQEKFLAEVSSTQTFTYAKSWEFNNVMHPTIFDQLQTSGVANIALKLDPNDVNTIGCSHCYNTRLRSIYVELTGDAQPNTVPDKIYLRVAHKGNSNFLIPDDKNGAIVKLLQQTPENIYEGTVLSFDQSNLVSSISDSHLTAKFLQTSLCSDTTEFFGTNPCKSPFAGYTIYVPRDDMVDCSSDPNDHIFGTNCKDLDYSKFTTIRFYAQVQAWSDYPDQTKFVPPV